MGIFRHFLKRRFSNKKILEEKSIGKKKRNLKNYRLESFKKQEDLRVWSTTEHRSNRNPSLLLKHNRRCEARSRNNQPYLPFSIQDLSPI